MTYRKMKTTQEVTCIDIPTMESMPIDDYKKHIEGGLVFVDHHDILRSEPAGYPIACTKAQLEAYIEYLNGIKHRLPV